MAHYTDDHSPHANKNERRRLINDERQSINLRQDRLLVAVPSFTQVPASTQGDVGHYTVAEEERSRISTIQQLALRFMSRLTTRDSPGQKILNESDFRCTFAFDPQAFVDRAKASRILHGLLPRHKRLRSAEPVLAAQAVTLMLPFEKKIYVANPFLESGQFEIYAIHSHEKLDKMKARGFVEVQIEHLSTDSD